MTLYGHIAQRHYCLVSFHKFGTVTSKIEKVTDVWSKHFWAISFKTHIFSGIYGLPSSTDSCSSVHAEEMLRAWLTSRSTNKQKPEKEVPWQDVCRATGSACVSPGKTSNAKRGPYNAYSPEKRANIGRVAIFNGKLWLVWVCVYNYKLKTYSIFTSMRSTYSCTWCMIFQTATSFFRD